MWQTWHTNILIFVGCDVVGKLIYVASVRLFTILTLSLVRELRSLSLDCCAGLHVLHNNSTHMLNYIFFSSQKEPELLVLKKIVAYRNITLALFMDNPIDIGPHDQT